MVNPEDDPVAMLELRPLAQEDLPFLLEVRNECRQFLHDDRMFTLEECEAWFKSTRPDFLMILMKGQPVGYIRLAQHDAAQRSIQVGLDLHPEFRGRGLARRAYEQLWEWLKQQRDMLSVTLEVLSHNERALRLYQHLGFSETGRTSRAAFRDGVWVDSIHMARRL